MLTLQPSLSTSCRILKLNTESLSSYMYIIKTLHKHKLDPTKIVSQGYDGASVMSGCNSGVQQHIKQIAPQAGYVHWNTHCLNLASVDTAKNVQEAADFFIVMQNLYLFLSSVKAHTIFVQKQHEDYPGKPIRQLQWLSDTQWVCRYFAIETIYTTYGAVLATLEAIIDGNDRANEIMAEEILHQIKSFKFLVTLILFWHILSCTESLSDRTASQPRKSMWTCMCSPGNFAAV